MAIIVIMIMLMVDGKNDNHNSRNIEGKGLNNEQECQLYWLISRIPTHIQIEISLDNER